jgi:hypothetical protein
MRSIHVHAHLTPQCYLQTVAKGKAMRGGTGSARDTLTISGKPCLGRLSCRQELLDGPIDHFRLLGHGEVTGFP